MTVVRKALSSFVVQRRSYVLWLILGVAALVVQCHEKRGEESTHGGEELEDLEEALLRNTSNTGRTVDGRLRYGLDVSFPVHGRVSTNYPWLPHNVDPVNNPTPPEYEGWPIQPLGDRQRVYSEYLEGCRQYYSDVPTACDDYEHTRLLVNLRQPASMKNYTKTGFQKIRAPDNVVRLIETFWRKNHFKGTKEELPVGTTHVNTWASPSYLISVDDSNLRGSGSKFKDEVWAAASATLEAWTSEELQPVGMYGIRVYGEGAIVLPTVDRLPLVITAVLVVAADVDEDWPTEVYDHDGIAHNVTLQPGDMLLLEGHSTIYGNPFPLKGRYFSVLFLHFEPTGHPLLHNDTGFYFRTGSGKEPIASSSKIDLPPYLKRESPEEAIWRESHPEGWVPPAETLPREAHAAAMTGLIDKLTEQLRENREQVLTERDDHGWQALHQGVAAGNQEVVELLIRHGAEINARTHGGYGSTPLRIAEERLGKFHPVVDYLKGLGALSVGPDL